MERGDSEDSFMLYQCLGNLVFGGFQLFEPMQSHGLTGSLQTLEKFALLSQTPYPDSTNDGKYHLVDDGTHKNTSDMLAKC